IPQEEMDEWLVRNTDLVQIEHVNTRTNLRTHDVASPLTPTNMEFTTVALNDTEAFDDSVWQINIDGAASNHTVLKTTSSFIRVVSHTHGVAMWTHGKRLPDWGHGHQEINGNKKPNEGSNLWTITEIRGRKEGDKEPDTMIPRLGFFAKYAELQGLMIKHNNLLTSVHPFQSNPITWPLLTRGISFWTNAKDRTQIYLLGNPLGWWLSGCSLVAYAAVMVGLELLNRRNIDVVDGIVSRHMARSTGFIAFAWFIHYFPFFLMGRSLFLHHYLPALIFAYMMAGACFQFFLRWTDKARALLPSSTAGVIFAVLVAIQVATFIFFAPITYGTTSLTPEGVVRRMWLPSYDLHFQK
ncbi:Dolichyl-phosphate-mannose--protein mannosyltransferase 4, partial [Dipsacomyces acuminosporus]